MLRPIAAFSALAFIASPVVAATYSASTSQPASGRIAARDILWTCASSSCTGSTENSRPLVLCQGLAKQVGPIQSFNVNGQAIGSEELACCNASAKGADQKKVVANAR